MQDKSNQKASILFGFSCLIAVVIILVVNIRAGMTNYGLSGDEVFSYISSTSMGGFKSICFLDDQTWYDGSYFADALVATGDERFNIPMVVENQAQDTHPPLFYIFLNLVCSVFSGQFSEWYGIGVNLAFSLCVGVALYLLLQYFLHNRWLSLIFSTIFCCSRMSIDLVLFIRMYVLLTFLAVLQTWYHLRLLDAVRTQRDEEISIRKDWSTYVILAILTILGSLTHYYFLVWMALIATWYVVALWREHRIKAIRYYVVTMIISAGLYIAMYPAVINHLFLKYRGREAVHKFIKGSSLFGDVISMFHNVDTRLFKGCSLPILAVLAIITGVLVYRKRIGSRQVGRAVILVLPIVIYFVGISKASPYVTSRYVSPVIPLAYAVVVAWAVHLTNYADHSQIRNLLLGVIICATLGTSFYLGTPAIKEDSYSIKRDVVETLADEADYCVYLTADDYDWKMWDDYVYYPLFKGLYFLDGREQNGITDEQLLAQDTLAVFIDKSLDVDDTVEYLKKYLPEQEFELVYETNNVAYYLAY